MKARLTSDGMAHNTKVLVGQTSLKGVTRASVDISADDPQVSLRVELVQQEIDVSGELKVVGIHPLDGDQRQIAKIIYADGSEWSAQ